MTFLLLYTKLSSKIYNFLLKDNSRLKINILFLKFLHFINHMIVLVGLDKNPYYFNETLHLTFTYRSNILFHRSCTCVYINLNLKFFSVKLRLHYIKVHVPRFMHMRFSIHRKKFNFLNGCSASYVDFTAKISTCCFFIVSFHHFDEIEVVSM